MKIRWSKLQSGQRVVKSFRSEVQVYKASHDAFKSSYCVLALALVCPGGRVWRRSYPKSVTPTSAASEPTSRGVASTRQHHQDYFLPSKFMKLASAELNRCFEVQQTLMRCDEWIKSLQEAPSSSGASVE